MKQIPLTRGLVALVDDQDFERINSFDWHALVLPRVNYAIRDSKTLDGRKTTVRMSREILGVFDPTVKLDHRDGDGLNNRRENLRVATTAQNAANMRKRLGTSSRFKGVAYRKDAGLWRARIAPLGAEISLGYFIDEEEAACAYDRAAIEHFGEFAKLNFPLCLA